MSFLRRSRNKGSVRGSRRSRLGQIRASRQEGFIGCVLNWLRFEEHQEEHLPSQWKAYKQFCPTRPSILWSLQVLLLLLPNGGLSCQLLKRLLLGWLLSLSVFCLLHRLMSGLSIQGLILPCCSGALISAHLVILLCWITSSMASLWSVTFPLILGLAPRWSGACS